MGVGARETFVPAPARRAVLLRNTMLHHLLAQRIAIDAQHLRGARLVAAGVFQHHFEQWFFNAVHHHVIHVAAGFFAVEILEIFLERLAHTARYVIFVHFAIVHAASSST